MEIEIVHDSTIPLHMQLLNQLRHLILSGQWTPGSRLPSETELRQELNISRGTIRQALSHAETEGLIKRVPGRGTFVARFPASGANRHLIGYITVDLLNSNFHYQLLRGAESAATAMGYRLLYSTSSHDTDEESRLLDQLLQDRVGGILIWPMLSDDPSRRLFQLVTQELIPLVLIDRALPGIASEYVTSDNYTGAFTAVKHLLDLGHQRIAFLSNRIVQLLPIGERLRGYHQALKDANLSPLEPWLVGTSGQELGTRRALKAYGDGTGQEIEQIIRYLKAPQRPSAIFAINDLMAMLVLKAASLVGLRVPEELSVVGFDDMDIVAHLETPLTTVAQDGFAIGRRAAGLLIERIEGYKGPLRQEMIPTQLKVRSSTTSPITSRIPEKLSKPAV